MFFGLGMVLCISVLWGRGVGIRTQLPSEKLRCTHRLRPLDSQLIYAVLMFRIGNRLRLPIQYSSNSPFEMRWS